MMVDSMCRQHKIQIEMWLMMSAQSDSLLQRILYEMYIFQMIFFLIFEILKISLMISVCH